jgi:hypothetical protein
MPARKKAASPSSTAKPAAKAPSSPKRGGGILSASQAKQRGMGLQPITPGPTATSKAARVQSPASASTSTDHGLQARATPSVSTRPDMIQVRGARQNNLRSVDVDIPLGELKVETFPPYTPQCFDRMDVSKSAIPGKNA